MIYYPDFDRTPTRIFLLWYLRSVLDSLGFLNPMPPSNAVVSDFQSIPSHKPLEPTELFPTASAQINQLSKIQPCTISINNACPPEIRVPFCPA